MNKSQNRPVNPDKNKKMAGSAGAPPCGAAEIIVLPGTVIIVMGRPVYKRRKDLPQ